MTRASQNLEEPAAPPGKKRRSRFGRYSLRSLLLVVTFVACVLGWWCSGPRKQRLAVESLQAGNASVDYDDFDRRYIPDWLFKLLGQDAFASVVAVQLPPFCRDAHLDLSALDRLADVRELECRYPKSGDGVLEHIGGMARLQELSLGDATGYSQECRSVSDAGVAHLQRLVSLEVLELSGAKITDAGLAHLAGLTALKELDLSLTKLSDEGLRHLAAMKQLQYLSLFHTKVNGAGLEHLAGLTALNDLNLADTLVDDSGLTHLAGLTALQSLVLRGTKISDDLEPLTHLSALTFLSLGITNVGDAGLAHLASMTNLTYLNLRGTRVTDAGLQHLRGLTKLTSLDLAGADVTDAGLAHLKDLTLLQYLDLDRTQVTKAGIAQLPLASDCQITFEGKTCTFGNLEVSPFE